MGIRDALPGRDEWEHGTVMGTVNAAGAAFTIAAIGHAADLDPEWGAIGGGVGAVAAVVAGRRAGLSGQSIGYRAGCWTCVGAWVTRTLATTPWDVVHVGALAAGALGAGLLAPALARHERRDAERRALRLAITARQQRATEWEDRLARVCGARGARVVAVETWPTTTGDDGQELETGYTVEVILPRGGMTWRDIATRAAGLASDADLPEGCSVEVRAGARRSRALLRVSTLNALSRVLPYPDDHPHISANNAYGIGQYRDSTPALVHTRERTVLVVGQKGGGKTNLLHVFIGRLAEMVDQLIWVIDLNGGGLAQPWLKPWLERRALRPAVDWVAADPDEALRMVQAAIRIGRGRKVAYRDLRHAHDTDLLPVSPTLPQITIVIDESKSITGDGVRDRTRIRLGEELLTAQEELRAEGVNLIRCSLRPTGSALGGVDARVQSAVQIMMKPGEPEELHKLFAQSAGLDPSDAPYPGNGWLAVDGGRPAPFQAYRLTPKAIDRIAVAVSDRRPALDEASAHLAGPDYATRWDPDRIAWLYADTPALAGVAGGGDTGRGAPVEDTGGVPLMDTSRMEDLAAQLRAERETSERARLGDDLTPEEIDRRLEEIAAAWDETTPPAGVGGETPAAGDEAGRPDPRVRLMELVRDAGPDGVGPKRLAELLQAEGYTTTRQTAQGWLGEAVTRGEVWRRRGGRYVHADYPQPDDAE